jgi:cell division septal protein FtsQ
LADPRLARGTRRARASGRVDPVREHAIRAARSAGLGAAPPPPAIARAGFLTWAAVRLLALVVLVVAAYLVYTAATSPQLQIRTIRVTGNVLLRQSEVEEALGLRGVNLFWVERTEAAGRLANLAPVRSATVTPVLPDTLDVNIVERQPAGFWTSGNRTYLVDREGVILTAIDADSPPPRACGGQPCDPQSSQLLTVDNPDGQLLNAGDRVDAGALAAAVRLANRLPSVGIQPLGYDWSASTGVEVPTGDGWRVRFDAEAQHVDEEIATLSLVRQRLSQNGVSPQLIDVRFGNRPYFR